MQKATPNPMNTLVLKKYHYRDGKRVYEMPRPAPTFIIQHVYELHFDRVSGRFRNKVARIEPAIGVSVTDSRERKYIVGINGNLLRMN